METQQLEIRDISDVEPFIQNCVSRSARLFSKYDEIEIKLTMGASYDGNFYPYIRNPDHSAIIHTSSSSLHQESRTEYEYDDLGAALSFFGLEFTPEPGYRHTLHVVVTDAGWWCGEFYIKKQLQNTCMILAIDKNPMYDVFISVNAIFSFPSHTCMKFEDMGPWAICTKVERSMIPHSHSEKWDLFCSTCIISPINYTSYQIEMKLSPERKPAGSMPAIVQQLRDDASAAYLTLKKINTIRGTRCLLGVSNPLSIFSEYRACDDNVTRSLGSILASCMGIRTGTGNVFCLPEIHPITRGTLRLLSDASDVWITEKTEGVRVVLFISRDHGICLLDANGHAICMQGSIPALCEHGPTVFECELSEKTTATRSTLMIMRLLMKNGTPQYRFGFKTTYDDMRALVISHLMPYFGRTHVHQYPFDLHAKVFVPSNQLNELTDRMDRHPPDRNIKYDKNQSYRIDGLLVICTGSNGGWFYHCWKPVHRLSLVLIPKVDAMTHIADLSIVGKDNVLQTVVITQLPRDKWHQIVCTRLDAILAARVKSSTHQLPPILLMCKYDKINNTWYMDTVCTNRTSADDFLRFTAMLTAHIDPIKFQEFVGAFKK